MGLDLHFYKRKEEVLLLNSKSYFALTNFLNLCPFEYHILSKEFIENVIISQCDKICEKGEDGIEEFKRNNELVFDKSITTPEDLSYSKKDKELIIYYTMELKNSLKLITDYMKRDEVIEFYYDY